MDYHFLLLYSSNVAVKGKRRAAIYKLDKGIIYIIPATFYNVLKQLEKKPFVIVERKYEKEKLVFESYIKFLLDEKLAFFTDTPQCFPPMPIIYDSPEMIECVNIEYSGNYDLKGVITQLTECNCKYVRIYLNRPVQSIYELEEVLRLYSDSSVRSLELVLDIFSGLNNIVLNDLYARHKKLSTVIVCGAGSNQSLFLHQNAVYFITDCLYNFIKTQRFENLLIISYKYFFESHFFNPLYHKRAFIDGKGNIKNSMFTEEVFGNISQTTLYKVASTKGFQKLWKKTTRLLAESEFRYCLYNPGNFIDETKFKNCKVLELDNIIK